jgi:hypothetical protein
MVSGAAEGLRREVSIPSRPDKCDACPLAKEAGRPEIGRPQSRESCNPGKNPVRRVQ